MFLFSVSGLLLVVVHSGERLFAMDDDGFSDPYCIVAANNEKVRFSQSCIQLSFFQGGKNFRSFGTQYGRHVIKAHKGRESVCCYDGLKIGLNGYLKLFSS